MRALTWHGRHDVRLDTVPDPEIVNPRDAILRVTSKAIRGSDLHLYDGYIPTLRPGDVLGHEFMGEVAKTGWEAMNDGESAAIYELKNKLEVAAADVMTDATTAKLHRRQAEPGSGNR